MRQGNRVWLTVVLLFCPFMPIIAQDLKVTQSADNKKIDRDASDSTATIIIDSHVRGLTVDNDMNDEMIEIKNNRKSQFIIHVNIQKDRKNQIDNTSRSLLLNSPRSSEYVLETDELFPRQVYYYTVVLPEYFPLCASTEYIFTKFSKNAVRISAGKQFGGYISFKWGDYHKAGSDIKTVTADYDITKAEPLGYIRTAITGGLRYGVFQHPNIFEIYLLLGAGYGEFGRQWKNNYEVEKNIYFYSDYVKGGNVELAFQATLLNWVILSAGAEMIVGKGNITFDYVIGIGINVPITSLMSKMNK